MQDFVTSIRDDLKYGNYYGALFQTLMLPSICGALESDDGEDKGSRYISWYDKYITDLYLNGNDCYKLRCSMLHQGRTSHKHSSFSRVLFTLPGATIVAHNNLIDDALNLHVTLFCERLLEAVQTWLEELQSNDNAKKRLENYQRNLKETIRFYPDGLKPYLGGIPIIS